MPLGPGVGLGSGSFDEVGLGRLVGRAVGFGVGFAVGRTVGCDVGFVATAVGLGRGLRVAVLGAVVGDGAGLVVGLLVVGGAVAVVGASGGFPVGDSVLAEGRGALGVAVTRTGTVRGVAVVIGRGGLLGRFGARAGVELRVHCRGRFCGPRAFLFELRLGCDLVEPGLERSPLSAFRAVGCTVKAVEVGAGSVGVDSAVAVATSVALLEGFAFGVFTAGLL